MSKYFASRNKENTDQRLIDEFLAKGGKITKVKYGERSEQTENTKSFYGNRPKKKKTEDKK